MSNSVFPGQHTTTTTITASETQVDQTIRFDIEYLNKRDGQHRLAEIILSLVALFFVTFSNLMRYERVTFFETVAITAIWWNTVLLVLYLFHVVERFYRIPWLHVEVISASIFAAFYFLAALLSIAWIFTYAMFIFMLVACVLLTFLFAWEAYLKLQKIQAGEIAQGVRVVSQVTEVNEPGYRY